MKGICIPLETTLCVQILPQNNLMSGHSTIKSKGLSLSNDSSHGQTIWRRMSNDSICRKDFLPTQFKIVSEASPNLVPR